MLLNTSLILKLFCEKFKKLICHFTEIINLKLLVQHIFLLDFEALTCVFLSYPPSASYTSLVPTLLRLSLKYLPQSSRLILLLKTEETRLSCSIVVYISKLLASTIVVCQFSYLLEVHGAAVSNEDANQKFLRALPSSWNNVALIMRNKDGIDDLDIDDLYNNLKVFEADIKGSSGSSLNSQNVAFLSTEDTSSSNEVNTANGVSTASGHNSQGQASSSSYTDDLMFSFFANQSNSPQLDDEDLEQIDHDDLEEMDLKWQVAMLSMRVKRFYKKTGRKLIFNGKEPIGFDKTKGIGGRRNTRRTVPVWGGGPDTVVVQDNALIVQDGLGYDWSYIAQDEPTEFALMAYTSNSSGSDTELISRPRICRGSISCSIRKMKLSMKKRLQS
ncbi:hypothetical protein Tco_0475598 [Tanacetum coccineum]